MRTWQWRWHFVGCDAFQLAVKHPEFLWRFTTLHLFYKAYCVRLRLKYDGTRAETRFRLSAQRTSPFKSAGGRQFSWLQAAEMCASAVVMLDTQCSEVVWRVLATHSIRQFPPSVPLPCVTVCHHISTGVYYSDVVCSGLFTLFCWVLYCTTTATRWCKSEKEMGEIVWSCWNSCHHSTEIV